MEETLEEYFAKHPEEEDEFIDEMARLLVRDETIDYPEYWITSDWFKKGDVHADS